ncbi:MAG: PAS domain S-box protein, partial [Verrucomicrobia bacterium]|nr:PAS domain S-box protein [Verrucomicrobiota bacterium]
MHSTQNANRSLVFIAIAVGIAFILIALSLTVQYSDSLYAFCASMAHSPPAMLILNFLFFWLLVLLVLALRHWHRISSLNSDLEAVVSSISPDALLVVTPQRTVRMCNDSVERIFGYKPSEIIDHTTDMLYYDRRANTQHTREIFDVLARSGFHYGVATGKRKGGGTVPLEIISGELVGKNGAVLLVRDITERQAFEEQRRRLEQRALQAQKLESLGVLAGGVAHDFNNLLMIINGYVELMLLRQPADAGQNDSLLEIQKAANRACDICGSLLSFAGRAPRQIRPVSVTQVAEGAAKMVSVRVPPRVQVQLELAAEPPLIEGDAGQLHQIAMNLINNACEAIGNAPGHVSVSTGERVCDSDYLADAIGWSSGLMAG